MQEPMERERIAAHAGEEGILSRDSVSLTRGGERKPFCKGTRKTVTMRRARGRRRRWKKGDDDAKI